MVKVNAEAERVIGEIKHPQGRVVGRLVEINGQPRADFRLFVGADGEIPTQKGLNLPVADLPALMGLLESVHAASAK